MVDRPLHLLLVDSDSIFRLGLQAALQSRDDVAEVELQPDLAIALEQLQAGSDKFSNEPGSDLSVADKGPRSVPDLLLLRLDSSIRDRGFAHLERSLRQCRQVLPQLPIVGLDYESQPQLALWAQRMNLNSYWARGQSIPELMTALTQVMRGQRVWTLPNPAGLSQAGLIDMGRERRAPVSAGGRASEEGLMGDSWEPGVRHGARRQGLWQRTVDSGIQQVEMRLQSLEFQRQSPRTGWVNQVWMAGHQRELRATRWLLNRLGGQEGPIVLSEDVVEQSWEMANSSSVPLRSTPSMMDVLPTVSEQANGAGQAWESLGSSPQAIATSSAVMLNSPSGSGIRPGSGSRRLQNLLLDRISQRMPPALLNYTDEPLEVDILKWPKRQELLATVLRCFGELLVDLRLSQPEPPFLSEKRSELLLDLWQASLSDFLGRYSSLNWQGETVELLPILLQEQEQVQRFILNPIPDVDEILGALLFEQPVTLDGVEYRPNSPEAMERLVRLTENLLISVANAVVQPLLNHVAEVEVIRQNFYDQRLLSTREIEKFRNNLSWKYRVAHLFREAQDIYESRHWLLQFSDRGIEKISIYAARRQELAELTPLQQSVTLMLETRDAIAPRLQFFAGWFGNGVVYVLTNVVGRGIGLIGRGIVQGVGSSIQDVRNLGQNNPRRKS